MGEFTHGHIKGDDKSEKGHDEERRHGHPHPKARFFFRTSATDATSGVTSSSSGGSSLRRSEIRGSVIIGSRATTGRGSTEVAAKT